MVLKAEHFPICPEKLFNYLARLFIGGLYGFLLFVLNKEFCLRSFAEGLLADTLRLEISAVL